MKKFNNFGDQRTLLCRGSYDVLGSEYQPEESETWLDGFYTLALPGQDQIS